MGYTTTMGCCFAKLAETRLAIYGRTASNTTLQPTCMITSRLLWAEGLGHGRARRNGAGTESWMHKGHVFQFRRR